jgi:hypothetical protein
VLWIVDITMVSQVVCVYQCSFSWSGYGFVVGLHAQLNLHLTAPNGREFLAATGT